MTPYDLRNPCEKVNMVRSSRWGIILRYMRLRTLDQIVCDCRDDETSRTERLLFMVHTSDGRDS